MRKSLTLALTAALIGVIAPSQASDDPELVFTADFEEVRESHSAQAGPFDSADASVSAAIDGTATLTSETFNRYSSEAWARADILAPTFEWDDSSLILEATVSYTYRYDGSTFLTTTHGLDLTETALFAIRDDLGEASLVPEPEVWRPKFSSTALARFSETAHHIEEGTFTVSSLFQNRCGGAARIKPVLTAMTELSNPARLFPKWDAESVALFVEVEEIRVYRTALVPCQTVHTIEVVENGFDPMELSIPIHDGITFDFSEAPAFSDVMLEDGDGRLYWVHPLEGEVFTFRKPQTVYYWNHATGHEGTLTVYAP